jgi:flagellar export protein FliJ
MKPFRFPLQAVKTVRVNHERKALEAFALAQAEYEKHAALRRAIEKEIDTVLTCRREMLAKTTSSEAIHVMQQGLRALHEALQRCQLELQKAQVVLEAKSKALLEARQKREVIDKLHDKQLAQHDAQVARDEQKTSDEFATLKSMGNLALKWR